MREIFNFLNFGEKKEKRRKKRKKRNKRNKRNIEVSKKFNFGNLKKYQELLSKIVYRIFRTRRDDELDGQDYHFISRYTYVYDFIIAHI